ncbi:MAG: hypothetical protein KF901_22415 [Myxococcales bacterium]|nr:hypothetical protein [Myxococcales bacterium]
MAGCYQSHLADAPDAAVSADAGPDAGRDAGRDVGPDASSCVVGSARIRVDVLPIGDAAVAAGCTSSARIADYSAALAQTSSLPDGVVLRVDLCPNADADCRCDVRVRGVGSDVIPLDLGSPIGLWIEPNAVIVEAALESPLLLLLAMDGVPEDPPIRYGDLLADWGDEECRGAGPGCQPVRHELRLTSFVDGFPGPIGTVTPVREGETAEIGELGLRGRAVRASYLDCAGARPTAAWAAWRP